MNKYSGIKTISEYQNFIMIRDEKLKVCGEEIRELNKTINKLKEDNQNFLLQSLSDKDQQQQQIGLANLEPNKNNTNESIIINFPNSTNDISNTNIQNSSNEKMDQTGNTQILKTKTDNETKFQMADKERQRLSKLVSKLEENLSLAKLETQHFSQECKVFSLELKKCKEKIKTSDEKNILLQNRYYDSTKHFEQLIEPINNMLLVLPDLSIIDSMKLEITKLNEDKSMLENELKSYELIRESHVGKKSMEKSIKSEKDKERDEVFEEIKATMNNSISSISKLNSHFFSDLLNEYHKLEEKTL